MKIVLNDVLPNKPQKPDINDKKYKAIIKDYKKHFPQLDETLKLLTAMRMGADRKESYLWLKATSNWGKSFFWDGVMSDLGIVTHIKEKELKKAMGGDPVGMNVEDFTFSWILLFEEFKGAVSELKDITHKLHLSPKNMSRATVDLYAKIFLSAENVNSLVGAKGAETQFSNRFMKLELDGELTKRELYIKDQVMYFDVLKHYVYLFLLKEIYEYIPLPKNKAAVKANEVLQKFRKKHPLVTNGGDMMITVKDDLFDFYRDVIMTKSRHYPSRMGYDNDILDNFVLKGDHLYVTNISVVKKYFIDKTYVDTEGANLKHKSAEEICHVGDYTSIAVNGVKINCRKVLTSAKSIFEQTTTLKWKG